MRINIILLFVFLLSCNQQNLSVGTAIKSDAVFGDDNRHEVSEASLKHKIWARSTAGMFPNEDVARYLKGEKLPLLSEHGVGIFHDGAWFPVKEMVCSEMKYATQPVGAHCSGFLVGPDLLVTAGHCVTNESNCKSKSWVFDFKVNAFGGVNIKRSNVFKCKEIISQQLTSAEPIYDPEEYAAYQNCLDNFGEGFYGDSMAYEHCDYPKPIRWDYTNEADFALVRLDRKVWFRKPFKVRTSGQIEKGARLTVIGHPLGLPTKVTNNGVVIENNYPHSFSSNLDAFKGNSGSVVINEDSGEVEGILVRGWSPFIHDKERDCYTIDPYDEMGSNVPESDWGLVRKDLLTGVNKITSITKLMEILQK